MRCSSFQSTYNSKLLSLKQLLHVPSITKNLVNVSKFDSDNKVYFDIFPKSCYVRDQITRNILMEGRIKEGLYAFDPPQFFSNSQIQPS